MTAPARPFQPFSAIFLVVLQLGAAVGVLLLGGALSRGDTVGAVFLGAAPVVAPLVALYVGLVRYAPDEPTAAAMGLARPSGAWRLVGLALVFGAAVAPALVAVQSLLFGLLPSEPMTSELEAELRAALERPGTVVFLGLAQVVLSPLAHEALYRGFIQPRLVSAAGAWRGVWITLLLYAAAQLDPRLLPLSLLLGLPLGILALAARTTWAPVAAHVTLSATPYVAETLGWGFVDLETGTLTAPAWVVVASAAVAAAVLALAWRLRLGDAPPLGGKG